MNDRTVPKDDSDWVMIGEGALSASEQAEADEIGRLRVQVTQLKADAARMDHIEAMARQQAFLGYEVRGLHRTFVELRRDGLLYSYDTVREATDAEMEMAAKER